MEMRDMSTIQGNCGMQRMAPLTQATSMESSSTEPVQPGDTFKPEEPVPGTLKKNAGALKSLALKTAVGAAVGAGVLALSGGSVIAAIGLSTAFCAGLGALKGLAHAFLGSINFGGHSGASSALDRNPIAMALLMGGLGAVKGAAEGAVLGGLSGLGFGPLGGAVAGAVMPSVEKVGWQLFEKYQINHGSHGLHD
jgi:hypothetical protein